MPYSLPSNWRAVAWLCLLLAPQLNREDPLQEGAPRAGVGEADTTPRQSLPKCQVDCLVVLLI